MKILAAYAIYNSTFHPMFPTRDKAATGLVRLGRKVGDEAWQDTDSVAVPEWRDEAARMLDALAEGDNEVQAAGVDTSAPANSVSKGLPWYVVFELTDPVDQAREIWAGRFMPDTVPSGETSLEGGVFYIFEGQGVFPGPDGEAPLLEPLQAEKSILFPTFSGINDETSAAKEQGCSLEGSNLRTDWPVHE